MGARREVKVSPLPGSQLDRTYGPVPTGFLAKSEVSIALTCRLWRGAPSRLRLTSELSGEGFAAARTGYGFSWSSSPTSLSNTRLAASWPARVVGLYRRSGSRAKATVTVLGDWARSGRAPDNKLATTRNASQIRMSA